MQKGLKTPTNPKPARTHPDRPTPAHPPRTQTCQPPQPQQQQPPQQQQRQQQRQQQQLQLQQQQQPQRRRRQQQQPQQQQPTANQSWSLQEPLHLRPPPRPLWLGPWPAVARKRLNPATPRRRWWKLSIALATRGRAPAADPPQKSFSLVGLSRFSGSGWTKRG